MTMATSRRPRRWIAAAALPWIVLVAGGCAGGPYTDYGTFLPETTLPVASSNYRIMPPDVIQIVAEQVREIHSHRE